MYFYRKYLEQQQQQQYLEIWQVIECIKHSENIHSIFSGQSTKLEDSIIRVVLVPDSVRSSQQHLEGNVWDGFSKTNQSIPRTLFQKSHGNIESGT